MRVAHLWLLLRTEVLRRQGRLWTAVVAIALAASVLLTSLAGLFAALDRAPNAADGVFGPCDVQVRADDLAHPYLDAALLGDLRADPRVASVTTARRIRVIDLPGTEQGGIDLARFHDVGGGYGGWGPQGRTALWAWCAAEPPLRLTAGRWPRDEATDPIELAVPPGAGSRRMAIGDWRYFESDTGLHRAVVVGHVDAGPLSDFSRDLPAWCVAPAAAEALAGPEFAPSDARVVLQRADDRAAFVAEWRPRLAHHAGRPILWDRTTLIEGHRDGFAVRAASTVARTAILLAAAIVACIALAVLGSAVRERAASYRLLRTIGATRTTLVLLVLLESVVLAVLGLAGAVLLAWAALAGLAPLLPFLSLTGGPPDLRCIALTFAVVLVGVLAGGAWPAWLAARSRPTDGAAAAHDAARSRRAAVRCSVSAAAVVAAASIVVILAPDNSPLRAELLAWVGVPAAAVAAVLLTPLALRLSAFVLLRPVAALLRCDRLLLEDQFTGDEPRSVASVLSIAVGLGAFLLTLSWGASMLSAFVLDPALPRWLVSIHPHGLDRVETERVLATEGLRHLQPLTLVDTRLGDATAKANETIEDVSCLVVGVDAARALPPSETSLPFRFVRGDAGQAASAVAAGRGCLLSDWFALDHGIEVGDVLRVVVPGRGTADGSGDVTYQVAGIVDLHGWRMVFKHNKTRQRNFKQQAMVVLAADVVRRDFGVAHTNYLIGDALDDPPYPQDVPLREAFVVSRAAREHVERTVAAAFDVNRRIENRSDAVTPVTTAGRAVMADDLDRTSWVLQTDWGGGAVRRLGWLPLLALILGFLPVAATMVGAMRARARELGIARSCGLTRAHMLRLAVAECLMVGSAAVFVAFAFGAAASWLLLRVSTIVGYHLRFVGIQPDLTVPWSWLGPGWLTTVAVCIAAAAFAVWRIGRLVPATLLGLPTASRV